MRNSEGESNRQGCSRGRKPYMSTSFARLRSVLTFCFLVGGMYVCVLLSLMPRKVCEASRRYIQDRPSMSCELKVRMHSAKSTSWGCRLRHKLNSSTAPLYVLFISISVISRPLAARSCEALLCPGIFDRKVYSLSTHFFTSKDPAGCRLPM